MIKNRRHFTGIVLASWLCLASMLISCSRESMQGRIILTLAGEGSGNADYVTGGSWRYIPHARLAALDPRRPGKPPQILTGDFTSACSPDISYDGTAMLFSGQLKEGSQWQIWEMNLRNGKVRQVIVSDNPCVDPVYLPGDRLAFCMVSGDDTLKAGCSVFTAGLDGSGLQRVTFNPNAYFALSVMHDGRLLAITREVYPEIRDPFCTVFRPDGTKADLFYQGTGRSRILSRARETEDGRLVFAESRDAEKSQGHLVSIKYNRPLHSRVDLTPGDAGDYLTACPMPGGNYLITCRKPGSNRYGLYEFSPDKAGPGRIILEDPSQDILDAMAVVPHVRPKKLPSEVDKGVKTGLLLCQDINFTGLGSGRQASLGEKATGIEILGIHASYGKVTVEPDGSFYLKVMADTPFRIRNLDADGKAVGKPSSWMWLRPNERRGCTGCHEELEFAPENRVSLAVKKNPVIIPVHVTEITEKEVELE